MAPKKGSRNFKWQPIIPGTQYGEWTVLSEMPRAARNRYAYCKCSCGVQKAVSLGTLKSGKSKRCVKCSNQETRNSQYVHGLKLRDRQTPEYGIWISTRSRARERGLEHTIRPQDIVIPKYCPILGIELHSGKGVSHGFKDNLASLDRVDSSLGYVPGNIRVISWRANRLKSDNTIETLEKLLAYMRNEAGLRRRREAEGALWVA